MYGTGWNKVRKLIVRILSVGNLKQYAMAIFPWSILHAVFFAVVRVGTKRYLRRLAKSDRPILVGPWISEVGFELIYWVPFLAWLCKQYQIAPSRLYIVSRGGVRSWYSTIASNYVELYDFVSPSDFKDHLLERKDNLATQKHILFSEWDKDLLKRIESTSGLGRVEYLHPKTMFHIFQEIWADGASREAYTMLRHHRLSGRDYPDISGLNLPPNYVLCRFYSSKCFNLDEHAKLSIKNLLAKLSERHNVVIVAPGFDLDDHSDVEFMLDKVTVIDSLPLTDNLGIQTALVANADLFITTYGGLSYLGILTGVATIALHTNGKFLASHLDTALRASRALNQANENAGAYAEYAVFGIGAIDQIIAMANDS